MQNKLTKYSISVATITAILGSLCCVGPFVLIALGFGTAWIGTLAVFHVIRPYAAVMTAFFLGIAFWRLYIRPMRCKGDESVCPPPRQLRVQRIVFWVVVIMAVLLLTFPWYGQFFLQ